MKPCDGHMPRIALYLDGSLRSQELADFESHLSKCANCRGVLAEEQQFREALRSARALYNTEAAFAPDTEEGVVRIAAYRAPARLRARVLKILEQAMAGNPKRCWPYLQTIAVLLLAHYMGLI